MLYLPEFLEMSPNDFLRLEAIPCLFNPSNVESTIHPVEATHTTHVVTIVCEFVARETVFGTVRQRVLWVGETVQIFAFPTIWATSTGEEEAAVLHSSHVGAGQAGVFLDVASRLGFYFAGRKGK